MDVLTFLGSESGGGGDVGKGEQVFRVRVRFTTEGGRSEARENPRRYA